MKIAIIGASGKAGSLIYKEAIARGHEVTAIVRNANESTKSRSWSFRKRRICFEGRWC